MASFDCCCRSISRAQVMMVMFTILLGFLFTMTPTTVQAFHLTPSSISTSTNKKQYHHERMMIPLFIDVTEAQSSPIQFVISNSNYDLNSRAATNNGDSILMDGIRTYNNNNLESSSTTTLLSLQEIKKVSQEELEQKKLTFNLIFWGGGFIAPFVATVFYFGFRFWEK